MPPMNMNITNDTTKRRRFQPPITTFFSTDSNPDPTRLSHHHYSAATYSPHPAVPAKVQASLLSVGMRVRKSVADGYKTLNSQGKAMHMDSGQKIPYKSHSELAPFSGMGKEGMGVQPFAGAGSQNQTSFEGDIITDEGDAYSLPASSQESTTSASYGQKRSLDSEDEEEEEQFAYTAVNSGRTILAPTLGQQRRRFAMQSQKVHMDVDDSEEPSFLRSREEVDADCLGSGYEVQMGGF